MSVEALDSQPHEEQRLMQSTTETLPDINLKTDLPARIPAPIPNTRSCGPDQLVRSLVMGYISQRDEQKKSAHQRRQDQPVIHAQLHAIV